MRTSKPQPPGSGGGDEGGAPNSYTRFIPREELRSFSAWSPASFEDGGARPAPGQSPAGGGVHKAPFAVRAGVAGAQAEAPQAGSPQAARPQPARKPPIIGGVPEPEKAGAPEPAPVEAPPPPPIDVDALTRDARQAGYQDGYRDGLAALESYKQQQAAQMAAFMTDQVGSLVADLHQRLETLEQQLSGRLARVAIELARQVARSEIEQRPELVVGVAEEALATLLTSAREVTLRLNPADCGMVQTGLAEPLRQRGARLVADPHVAVGGCVVESDIAVVDASVEARWMRAAAAMGSDLGWDETVKAPGTGFAPLADDAGETE